MFSKKKSSDPTNRTRMSRQIPREPVFLYHSSRSIRTDDKNDARRNRDKGEASLEERARSVTPRSRYPLTLVVAVLFFVAVAFCLRLNSNAKIVVIGDEAAASKIFLRDQKAYETAASTLFSGLLNRNKITVDTTKIAADMQKQFPELKAISISLPLSSPNPVVYIHPSVPELILVANGGLYLLDGNGRALITGNQVSDLDAFPAPVVVDESGLPVELGRIVLPEPTVTFIKEVVNQLQAKGITTTSLVLPQGTAELHVKVDGAGYLVKYNLHGDAREEVGAYIAAKERFEATGKTPGEYVDVRVVSRVYYK